MKRTTQVKSKFPVGTAGSTDKAVVSKVKRFSNNAPGFKAAKTAMKNKDVEVDPSKEYQMLGKKKAVNTYGMKNLKKA